LILPASPFIIKQNQIDEPANFSVKFLKPWKRNAPLLENEDRIDMSEQKIPEITYATAGLADEAFHRQFEQAAEDVRKTFGRHHPHYIRGKEVKSEEEFASTSPCDTGMVLGHFQKGGAKEARRALKAARAAFPKWRATPYQERARLMRRAADIITQRVHEVAALVAYETGKNRMEAFGEVGEATALMRYYAKQIEDAQGFVYRMGSETEDVVSVLRPFGVWAVISPFNFPIALAAGMSTGILVSGNTAIFKPSSDAPLSGLCLYQAFREAGVPPAAFNFVTGPGKAMERAILKNVDGIAFTGSLEGGVRLYGKLSKDYPRPCITEMGGKNPSIVMESADLDKAAEGVMRSAFGLSNQKCSACSRVYVHRSVEKPFLEKLLEKTRNIKVGDTIERDIFMGPVINARARDNYARYVETLKRDGKIVHGGELLKDPPYDKGYFVQPTVVTDVPLDHELFYHEMFVPIVMVGVVDSLKQAVELSNKSEYGLTAGLFSRDEKEIEYFFENIQTGTLYVNRSSGATTGAWPGVQSFVGWKGSGSTGKGGCGPYYVQQFLREQSRTIVKD
jgi:1-pyrroline-5-carboxylate dehydrogenase